MNWYQCSRCYCTTGARRWVFPFFFLTLASVGFIAEAKGNAAVNLLHECRWREASKFPEWLIGVLWLEIIVGISVCFNFFLRKCHLRLWYISPQRSSPCPSVSAVNLQMWTAFPCVMFLWYYFNVVCSCFWGFFYLFTIFCHFFPINNFEMCVSLS